MSNTSGPNSGDSQVEVNPLQEVVPQVVITAEDIAGAAEFWTQFEIPMPPELRAAFDAFIANPTVQTQNEVRLYITRAIANGEHEALKDEAFSEIRQECDSAAYDAAFDKALEGHLTTEGT